MSLKGKTALITGSTSGIGLGLAISFAEQGANIVLNGISNPEKAKTAIDAIKTAGSQAIYKQADVSDPAQIKALVQHATDTFGG
ncbi:MAG: SDR family NAD(P)-dependent oxidoreductase, partial [Cyanobacteria bacterium J06649_11]